MSNIPNSEWMREADDQLVRQEVLVVSRPMMVLCRFVNQYGIVDVNAQNAAGKAIDTWYRANYGQLNGLPDRHESRWILVWGQPFRVRIPFAFNSVGAFNVVDHIEGLPASIAEKLDPATIATLQSIFNDFQVQTSSILLFMTKARATRCSELVLNLVEAGWRDLRTCGDGFRPEDPAGSLPHAQHAAEKFMKGLLAFVDTSLDEEILRRRYGHSVTKLYKACIQYTNGFPTVLDHINRLSFDQRVRYERMPMRPSVALEAVDSSHHVCATVASTGLQRLRG